MCFKISILLVIVLRNCYCFTLTKYQNCCDNEGILINNNTQLKCSELNQNSRLQIATKHQNFSEFCVDIVNNNNNNNSQVKLYQISDSSLEELTTISVDTLPKCCPINYYYNTTTHSCDLSGDLPEIFNGYFLKIGLPNCKIINDIIVDHNITIGVLNELQQVYGDDHYCIDSDSNNQVRLLRICTTSYDVCKSKKCLIKCCPDGQSFVNGSNCKDTFVHGIQLDDLENIDDINAPFVLIHGYRKPIYRLTSTITYHLDEYGMFSMKEFEKKPMIFYQIEDNAYCIEYFEKNQLSGWAFFRTFPEQGITEDKFFYSRWAMMISVLSLILTIIYYCCSEQKKTLFGKTLICYCFCCLLLFSILVFTTFIIQIKEKICVIIGFILLYVSLSCFTWLNIMCFDIYWTFGSSKSFSSLHNKSKELKRFIWYSLYGWGFPMFLTLLPIIFYHVDVLPDQIKILIGKKKCWLQKDNYSRLVFSATPIAFSGICNTILFIKTIIYCLKVKGEINKMNDSNTLKNEKKHNLNKYTDRLVLLIKLFLIMGISFLFEVISMFYNFKQTPVTKYIEIVWDFFNSLDGLFIFIIFVCKKRVFKKFQKKLPIKFRKFSLISSGLTQTTLVAGCHQHQQHPKEQK